MNVHLFLYPGTDEQPPAPAGIRSTRLPASPRDAAGLLESALADPALDTVVFWDTRRGAIPWLEIRSFAQSLDDVWNGMSAGGASRDEDLLSFVQPMWQYRPDPPTVVDGAVHWKLDLRAAVVRASVLAQIGSFDPEFDTLDGAALELGYRLMRKGAICRQRAALGSQTGDRAISLSDRYRLLRRYFSGKWATYALVRRAMSGHPLGDELQSWQESRGLKSRPPVAALTRTIANVEVPRSPTVTVILPTFGRYKYLAEVLEDIRGQSVRATQILIADGNGPEDREAGFYDRFTDLPIEVLWHSETGICSGRNACLRKATGDYVWFVDDDSRFERDNLENHLRVLGAYGADVSVGPAFTRSRPELHGEQREVIPTHMDCGTTLVKRSLLADVGGFDMQFNQYLAGEDGELGIRFARAGGLMVNNPFAKRFHYVAPVGGSRTSKRSVHRFTRWALTPRPVQSIYYTALRYFEPGVAWDAMVQAALVAGWRRKEGVPATRSWKLKTLAGEVLAVPVTLWRLRESVRMGQEMFDGGPQIPPLG